MMYDGRFNEGRLHTDYTEKSNIAVFFFSGSFNEKPSKNQQ